MTVDIHHGDSREVLKTLADNSVDSCVCDPPYALVSIGKRFGADGAAPAKGNGAYMRASSGYSAKADAQDRLGSKHPTVKPVDLMAWLCKLVTPAAGVILDPFAGSGTTGLAAMGNGFSAILIEREAEYVADIRRRIAWANGEGRLTSQERARHTSDADSCGPLFATDRPTDRPTRLVYGKFSRDARSAQSE